MHSRRKSSPTSLGLPRAHCPAKPGELGCYHKSQDSYKSTWAVHTAEQCNNRDFFDPFRFVQVSKISDFYLKIRQKLHPLPALLEQKYPPTYSIVVLPLANPTELTWHCLPSGAYFVPHPFLPSHSATLSSIGNDSQCTVKQTYNLSWLNLKNSFLHNNWNQAGMQATAVQRLTAVIKHLHGKSMSCQVL